MEKIQDEESAKLEVTAAFQIARQTMVEKELTSTSTDKERDIEMTKREISELKKKMAENEATTPTVPEAQPKCSRLMPASDKNG